MESQGGEMTTTAESTTARSSNSMVLHWRRERCIAALKQLIPEPDSSTRGVFNEESIRILTAVFEIQRLELHSELEEQHIHISLIAKVIDVLATRSYFPDPSSNTLALEMESNLRLLAAALRIYKYYGKCLEHQLHQAVFDGINGMSSKYEDNKKHRVKKELVEDWNVAFLIKHCLYVLFSIDSSESLGRQIARKAIHGVDGALTAFGPQYNEIRPAIVTIVERQRSRPKWHEEYAQLEDACWSVFASDIRMRGPARDTDIEAFVEEARLTTFLLRESLEAHLSQRRKERKVTQAIRKAIGKVTEVAQDAGSPEEHSEHLIFGILDLLYQLSFRIRKRSRPPCFIDFVKVIRMVLERSPPSVAGLHLKATDLWNRILLLAKRDNFVYGEDVDCQAIRKLIKERRDAGVEQYEASEARSKRLQSQLKKLRREEEYFLQISTDDARVASNRQFLPSPIESRADPLAVTEVSSMQGTEAPEDWSDPPQFENPLAFLANLSEPNQEEIALLTDLITVQNRIIENLRRSRIPASRDIGHEPGQTFPPENHDSNIASRSSMTDTIDGAQDGNTSLSSELIRRDSNVPEAISSGADGSQLSRVDLGTRPSRSPSERASQSYFSADSRTTYPTVRSSVTHRKLGEKFSSRTTPFILLRGTEKNSSRTNFVVATCISGSSRTIAKIWEKEFLVYKANRSRQYDGKPKYVGRFGANGDWMYGLDGTPLTKQESIMTSRNRYGFNCASIRDDILAAGVWGSNCVMLFSIEDAGESGRFITKLENQDANLVTRKIIFNPTGTELGILFSTPDKEMWQFFFIETPTKLAATSRRNSHDSVTVNDETGFRAHPKLSAYSEVEVDNVVWRDSNRLLKYKTRDAKYSHDGSKLVTCTDHVQGTALVSILVKGSENKWRLWGTRRIHQEVHNWDEDCLGFTSVAFYSQKTTDDTLLFSADFPAATRKECYQIVEEDNTFELEGPKESRTCGDGKPSLALIVSSHGPRDVVAVVKADGGRILLYDSNGNMKELGLSKRIKGAERSSLRSICQLLSFAFTSNGEKLIFIDDRGETRIFKRQVLHSSDEAGEGVIGEEDQNMV